MVYQSWKWLSHLAQICSWNQMVSLRNLIQSWPESHKYVLWTKSEKNFSKEGKKVLVYQIRNQIFPFKIQITAQGPSLWEPRTSWLQDSSLQKEGGSSHLSQTKSKSNNAVFCRQALVVSLSVKGFKCFAALSPLLSHNYSTAAMEERLWEKVSMVREWLYLVGRRDRCYH